MNLKSLLLVGACGLALPSCGGGSVGSGSATRDVLVVSNNWSGTADFVDVNTFQRLMRLNIVPARPSARRRSTAIRIASGISLRFAN